MVLCSLVSRPSTWKILQLIFHYLRTELGTDSDQMWTITTEQDEEIEGLTDCETDEAIEFMSESD
jgi:hypothetical protein